MTKVPRRRQGDRPALQRRSFFFIRVTGVFLALIASIFLPAVSYAVEYSIVPSVSLREEVNDNILMTAGPHSTVWGSHLSPSFRFSAAMERWRLDGDFWSSISRYVGEDGLDMNDASLRLSSEYNTELDRWRLFGAMTRDAAWKSELLETGLVLGLQRRTLGAIGGSWRRTVTERVSVKGELEYREARYSDDRSGGLFDYQLLIGTIETIYALSEKDQLSASLEILDYRADSVGVESKNMGLSLSWVHPVSETFQWTLSVGVRELFTHFSSGGETQKSEEFGWLAAAMLQKKWERTLLKGDFIQQIDPSGAGYLIEVNRLSGAIEQKLTENMVGSLVANFYRTRPLQGDLSPPDSIAYNVGPRWSWHWIEEWSMLFDYRYAWLKRDDGSHPIHSNSISWMLIYRGLGWSKSR